jgi:hypothetical protein
VVTKVQADAAARASVTFPELIAATFGCFGPMVPLSLSLQAAIPSCTPRKKKATPPCTVLSVHHATPRGNYIVELQTATSSLVAPQRIHFSLDIGFVASFRIHESGHMSIFIQWS